MSERANLILRLAALALGTVVIQIAMVSQISLLGVSADLVPLVVASTAVLCGSVTGALMGFVAGMWVDLALVQTLGVSSLVLTGVGYAVGRLREARDPAHALVPVAVGASATLVAAIGFAIIEFMLGVDAPVSALLLRQILAQTLVNALLAAPVYAVVRRIVAGSLPQDPRRRARKRRAYSTTGLSPLTSSRSR